MGIDVADIKYNYHLVTGIESGFYLLDEHLNDFKIGELTGLLGRNNEGKTTMISQIVSHCIHKKTPVYLYSGELSKQKVQDWIYRGIVGKNERYFNILNGKYKKEYVIKPEIIDAIKKWHKELFFLFDNNDSLKLKSINEFFNVLENDMKKFKPKLIIIDNLATSIEENSHSIYADQGNFTQTCKLLSIKYKCHVMLAIHPNKTREEINTTNQIPNLEKIDISGSNNIANKCDNVIAIERNFYEGEDRIQYDGWISVLKDRETGQRKITPEGPHYPMPHRWYAEACIDEHCNIIPGSVK